MMKSEGTAANRMQTNGRKDLVNLQSTEAKGEIKMTNPQENNSEHKHNRQPKWIFAVVFIAAVVIICIATVLINRNSDKSTDGENSTAKTEENEPQSSEDEQKEPAATQDPDNDTEAPDSQQPATASAQTDPQSSTEAPAAGDRRRRTPRCIRDRYERRLYGNHRVSASTAVFIL